MEKKYQERHRKGLCTQCGEPADGNRLCQRCGQAYEKNQTSRYERRKAAGLCVWHGTRPATSGSVFCEECRKKSAARALERHRRSKANRTCRRCGKPAVSGLVHCEEHRREANKKSTDLHKSKRATGTCYYCNNPARPGRVSCTDCTKKAQDRHRAQYASRKSRMRSERDELKLEVFKAYGGPVCVGCGEKEFDTLQIDKTAGNSKRYTPIGLYKTCVTLKDEGFPRGFRVLCINCKIRMKWRRSYHTLFWGPTAPG
jgi:hypothetical protein